MKQGLKRAGTVVREKGARAAREGGGLVREVLGETRYNTEEAEAQSFTDKYLGTGGNYDKERRYLIDNPDFKLLSPQEVRTWISFCMSTLGHPKLEGAKRLGIYRYEEAMDVPEDQRIQTKLNHLKGLLDHPAGTGLDKRALHKRNDFPWKELAIALIPDGTPTPVQIYVFLTKALSAEYAQHPGETMWNLISILIEKFDKFIAKVEEEDKEKVLADKLTEQVPADMGRTVQERTEVILREETIQLPDQLPQEPPGMQRKNQQTLESVALVAMHLAEKCGTIAQDRSKKNGEDLKRKDGTFAEMTERAQSLPELLQSPLSLELRNEVRQQFGNCRAELHKELQTSEEKQIDIFLQKLRRELPGRIEDTAQEEISGILRGITPNPLEKLLSHTPEFLEAWQRSIQKFTLTLAAEIRKLADVEKATRKSQFSTSRSLEEVQTRQRELARMITTAFQGLEIQIEGSISALRNELEIRMAALIRQHCDSIIQTLADHGVQGVSGLTAENFIIPGKRRVAEYCSALQSRLASNLLSAITPVFSEHLQKEISDLEASVTIQRNQEAYIQKVQQLLSMIEERVIKRTDTSVAEALVDLRSTLKRLPTQIKSPLHAELNAGFRKWEMDRGAERADRDRGRAGEYSEGWGVVRKEFIDLLPGVSETKGVMRIVKAVRDMFRNRDLRPRK